MKKTITMVLLFTFLAMQGCHVPDVPGQGTGTPPSDSSNVAMSEEDAFAVYQPIIDGLFAVAAGNYDENNIPGGGTAMLEGNGWNDNDAMLWDAGYMIRDLSGDGIPELLIGSTAGEEYDIAAGTMIYALYTVADGQPHLTLEGAYRNAYHLQKDGSIFNHGSGGAIYAIYGIFDLTQDGTALSCRDYWFTHEKDGNFEDIRCYHNKTGEMNPDVSEELSISLDEFYEKSDALAVERQVLDLITFAEYGNVEMPYAEEPVLSAVYGSDYAGEYEAFVADDAEYAVDVVFTTDGAVRDFKVLALEVTEIADDGSMSFFYDELYFHGDLLPGMGLSVKMSLPETIPFYGISYRDNSGAERIFSVNLSGYDGSVYLTEIGGVG